MGRDHGLPLTEGEDDEPWQIETRRGAIGPPRRHSRTWGALSDRYDRDAPYPNRPTADAPRCNAA
jgi:hypothetical protein